MAQFEAAQTVNRVSSVTYEKLSVKKLLFA